MFDNIVSFFNNTVKLLSKHGADPALAFALFATFVVVLLKGDQTQQIVGLVGLSIIWFGYHRRCVASEAHEERMALQRVDNLERTRGAAIRSRQRQKRLGKKQASAKGDNQ